MSESKDEEVLEFTLQRNTKRIKIDGVAYTLKELDGVQLGRWRTQMSERVKTDSKGNVVGVKDFTGAEASLIFLCIRDHEDKQVEIALIERWPATVQNKLFNLCREMNGLVEDEKKG